MEKPDVAWIGVVGPRKFDRWQELTEAVARDWPGHPDPLDDAAVMRRFRQLAAQATRPWPSIRRQVIDDAPAILLLAFPNFKRPRRFTPWARRVLRNYAVSLYRRQRRTFTGSEVLDTVASPLALPPEGDLAEVLGDFRRLCDRVRFGRPTARTPELTAVFALETRLRLLDDLVHWGPDFLNRHLPLRPRERALRVRPGWPTLGELWEDLANSAEPGLRHLDAVRRACRRLAPHAAVAGLHKVWNTWLHRSKRAVASQLESEAQARLFYHLFPKHRPGEAERGPDGPESRRQAS